MINFPCFEGAAHRNIKFNFTVLQILRCAAPLYVMSPFFCYKYCGALHLAYFFRP